MPGKRPRGATPPHGCRELVRVVRQTLVDLGTPAQKCVRNDTLGRWCDARKGVAADGSPDIERAHGESPKESALGGMSSQYECRVHGAGLADAIDATNALLNPRGSPRQLETHDPSRPVLEVQSLAGHVRREKH
jgi:hypothetical protein